MSRQQWGNGYWKGVQDAQNGKVFNIDSAAKYWIKWMINENEVKNLNRSIYPVNEFYYWAMESGYTHGQVKAVYDRILKGDMYNGHCFVTGLNGCEWFDDFFVLPRKDIVEYWNQKEDEQNG